VKASPRVTEEEESEDSSSGVVIVMLVIAVVIVLASIPVIYLIWKKYCRDKINKTEGDSIMIDGHKPSHVVGTNEPQIILQEGPLVLEEIDDEENKRLGSVVVTKGEEKAEGSLDN